jgi:hypothetical protein
MSFDSSTAQLVAEFDPSTAQPVFASQEELNAYVAKNANTSPFRIVQRQKPVDVIVGAMPTKPLQRGDLLKTYDNLYNIGARADESYRSALEGLGAAARSKPEEYRLGPGLNELAQTSDVAMRAIGVPFAPFAGAAGEVGRQIVPGQFPRLREAVGGAAETATYFAPIPGLAGVRAARAAKAAPHITPSDIASPIPTDVIAAGKAKIEAAMRTGPRVEPRPQPMEAPLDTKTGQQIRGQEPYRPEPVSPVEQGRGPEAARSSGDVQAHAPQGVVEQGGVAPNTTWEPLYNKDNIKIGWYNPETKARLPLNAKSPETPPNPAQDYIPPRPAIAERPGDAPGAVASGLDVPPPEVVAARREAAPPPVVGRVGTPEAATQGSLVDFLSGKPTEFVGYDGTKRVAQYVDHGDLGVHGLRFTTPEGKPIEEYIANESMASNWFLHHGDIQKTAPENVVVSPRGAAAEYPEAGGGREASTNAGERVAVTPELNVEPGAEGLSQTIIPGAEQSARQLAAARESTGHGLKATRAEQQAPGGMFEPPKVEEADMFAPRQAPQGEGVAVPTRHYLDAETGNVEQRPAPTRHYLNEATGQVEAREAPPNEMQIPPQRPRALKPIEGTGETRQRAIGGELYNVGEEAPQIAAADQLVAKNHNNAIAIALRQKQPPEGVHPEFVYIAVEDKAIRDGNFELQLKLSKSPIAAEDTTMGQRIAALRNRAKLNPVEDMRSISTAREVKLKERGVDVAKELNTFVESALKETSLAVKAARKTSKRMTWIDLDSFIAASTCKA